MVKDGGNYSIRLRSGISWSEAGFSFAFWSRSAQTPRNEKRWPKDEIGPTRF